MQPGLALGPLTGLTVDCVPISEADPPSWPCLHAIHSTNTSRNWRKEQRVMGLGVMESRSGAFWGTDTRLWPSSLSVKQSCSKRMWHFAALRWSQIQIKQTQTPSLSPHPVSFLACPSRTKACSDEWPTGWDNKRNSPFLTIANHIWLLWDLKKYCNYI